MRMMRTAVSVICSGVRRAMRTSSAICGPSATTTTTTPTTTTISTEKMSQTTSSGSQICCLFLMSWRLGTPFSRRSSCVITLDPTTPVPARQHVAISGHVVGRCYSAETHGEHSIPQGFCGIFTPFSVRFRLDVLGTSIRVPFSE
jgi:hypothetical protein